MKEELDIEELETILGIENKSKEIKSLFSQQNSNPTSFLQAVSLISNSNQFGSTPENNIDHDQSQQSDIQDLIKNSSNFFSLENTEKLKIEFNKPSTNKIPIEEYEIIIKETKGNQNKNNKNINNNTNNNMNNINNKDEKNKKQKNKKKKKKEDKKVIYILIKVLMD